VRANGGVYRCLSRTSHDLSHQPLPDDHGPVAGSSTAAEAESAAAPEIPEEFQPDQLPRALFGYDRSTIVELLGTLSRRIKSLTQERTDRDRRIAELEARIKQNEENHRLIAETLVGASEEASTIREDARQSAEQVLHAARKQADLILAESEQEARVQAKEIVESAQREREELIDSANRERQVVLDEAGRARAFVEETHEQLSDFLMAAVKWYEQAKPSSAPQPDAQPAEPPSSPANERSSIPSA
jgi:cell division septum initiation protein DivIVA